MVLYKLRLCTNFEVVIFSPCRNINGEPPNLGSYSSRGHAHFSSEWDFMMGLSKLKQAVCQI